MHTFFYTCIALYFTTNFMPCISLSVSTTDIEPNRESLNDSTSEPSACSDEDEGTANGRTSDHHPTQAKRRIIWKKANLIRDPQTVQFSGQSELPEFIAELETPFQYFKFLFPLEELRVGLVGIGS